MSTTKYRNLSAQQVSYLKANASKLNDLCAPGETWVTADAPTRFKKRMYVLEKYGVVKCVGTVSQESVKKNLWETNPAAWEAIQTMVSGRDTLPCGHTGWRNCGEGIFECLTCQQAVERCDLPDAS